MTLTNSDFKASGEGLKTPIFYFIPMEATKVLRMNKESNCALLDQNRLKKIFGDEDLLRYMAIINYIEEKYRDICNPNLDNGIKTPFPIKYRWMLEDTPMFATMMDEYKTVIEKRINDIDGVKNTMDAWRNTTPPVEELYIISPLTTDSLYLVEIHEDFIIALRDRDVIFKFISDCLKVLCKELSYETIASHYLLFNSYIKNLPCSETV